MTSSSQKIRNCPGIILCAMIIGAQEMRPVKTAATQTKPADGPIFSCLPKTRQKLWPPPCSRMELTFWASRKNRWRLRMTRLTSPKSACKKPGAMPPPTLRKITRRKMLRWEDLSKYRNNVNQRHSNVKSIHGKKYSKSFPGL